MTTKTAFVLVHGAWHGGWCWAPVAAALARAGHRVFAPSLTGLADRAHLFGAQVSLATHVEDIVRLIEWEGLDGCVLVGHSYGGNVISGVADRLRERIGHYVFLDAVVPPDGATNWRWADFDSDIDREARLLSIAGQGAGVALPAPAPEVFGLQDPAMIAWVGEHLTPMPANTYLGEIRFEHGASAGLPRTYIGVENPSYPRTQRGYERIRNTPGWNFLTVTGGHDAMISAPGPLSDLLLQIAFDSAQQG